MKKMAPASAADLVTSNKTESRSLLRRRGCSAAVALSIKKVRLAAFELQRAGRVPVAGDDKEDALYSLARSLVLVPTPARGQAAGNLTVTDIEYSFVRLVFLFTPKKF